GDGRGAGVGVGRGTGERQDRLAGLAQAAVTADGTGQLQPAAGRLDVDRSRGVEHEIGADDIDAGDVVRCDAARADVDVRVHNAVAEGERRSAELDGVDVEVADVIDAVLANRHAAVEDDGWAGVVERRAARTPVTLVGPEGVGRPRPEVR